MAKLNGGHSTHFLDYARNPRETFNMAIIPNSGTTGSGSAIGQNGNLFQEDQAKSPCRTRTGEHDMVI
jgi:hypothetical protein